MKSKSIAAGAIALTAALGAHAYAQVAASQEVRPLEAASRQAAAAPQQTAGGRARGGGGTIGAGVPVGGKMTVPVEARLVKGAPYFAEVATESIQTLADGNRIVHKTTGRVYRDSQGRTRREDDLEPGKVRTIAIVDPVAGVSYSLNPETRVASKTPYRTARRIEWTPPGGSLVDVQVEDLRRFVDTARPLPPIPRVEFEEEVEKLRARQIEGVTAEGLRTTRTIAAGVVGNELPLVWVTEEWRSPELQVLVMTRTVDPRTGERTYRLLAIQRSEPNATWFEVPGDYTVRDAGVPRWAPQKP